jgi:cytochrome c
MSNPFSYGIGMRATKIVTATLALTSLLAVAAYAEGDASRGEARFQECAACHRLQPGANEVGPSLHGIFSRRAGELADFRYSPAMKRSGIAWTAETLDKYVADPQGFIPANRMPYAGMSNANDRADLIVYLQNATK